MTDESTVPAAAPSPARSVDERIAAAVADGRLRESAAAEIARWRTNERYADARAEIEALVAAEAFDELNDRFWRVLPFGTGGRRGPVGVGSNRVNRWTIEEGAQGLADVLLKERTDDRPLKAALAWDTRTTSVELADATTEVLAGNGIHVYRFDGFRATPELSFAVRELACDAGIVISASHNPPADNGFKCYGADGAQVIRPRDAEIIAAVKAVTTVHRRPIAEATAAGLVHTLGAELDERYVAAVLGIRPLPAEPDAATKGALNIVYTPLHGAGLRSVKPVLEAAGFTGLTLVESQATPDGTFPNVPDRTPNPEVTKGLSAAIEQARVTGADLVLATDPDADRLAVAVRADAADPDVWVPLSGNDTGALLGAYAMECAARAGRLTPDTLVCTTVVTSGLLGEIARGYRIRAVTNLLVGFKYIAEQVRMLPDPALFLYGTEESIGYTAGAYARDKDAAAAALLAAELTAVEKARGRTLLDALDDIFVRWGCFRSTTVNVFFEGLTGTERMAATMQRLRDDPPRHIGGIAVQRVTDRLKGETWIPGGPRTPYPPPQGHTDNLLIFALDDGPLSGGEASDGLSFVAVRPSGTEPKLKLYAVVQAPVSDAAALPGVKAALDAALALIAADLSAYANA